jgi:hypothetical protein
MAENHFLSMLPYLPAAELDDTVVVLGLLQGMAAPTYADSHGRGHVDLQGCPGCLNEGASEDDIVRSLGGRQTEFTCVRIHYA